jgi:signal recognition particle receptor subunit beta
MATLDPRNDAVVIRVVYDGAPTAGKSTSVRALGRGLGGEVVSPAEVSGRTLYFDWLDYTGGLFEGRRIRCQIISVPGQATLAPRRRRLLETADVIVFVGDSTPGGFAGDRSYLSGLQTVLERLSGPPVGIVFQANKRDHTEAVPLDTIRSMLQELGLRVGVVESIATESSGIREAFVFAVRLALDRVRELMRTGELAGNRPAVDSPQELLRDLKLQEEGSMDYAAESGLVHTRVAELQTDSLVASALAEVAQADAVEPDVAQADVVQAAMARAPTLHAADDEAESQTADAPDDVPAIPDERVASGFVWPPVDGRMVLHELTQAHVPLTRAADGAWDGEVPGRWRLHSDAYEVFDELEEGRSVLVRYARIQSVAARDRVASCCIALAADGHGRHRLWRIERIAAN